MTKEAALQFWFESLGITAYQNDAVPSGDLAPSYPYMTYEMITGSWDEPIPLSINLWYRSTSWLAANAMARHISEQISRGGTTIPCEDGTIWITRGTPFARSARDDTDDQVKRKILTIMVEYFTED